MTKAKIYFFQIEIKILNGIKQFGNKLFEAAKYATVTVVGVKLH